MYEQIIYITVHFKLFLHATFLQKRKQYLDLEMLVTCVRIEKLTLCIVCLKNEYCRNALKSLTVCNTSICA